MPRPNKYVPRSFRNKGYRDIGFLPWSPVVHPPRKLTPPKDWTGYLQTEEDVLRGSIAQAKRNRRPSDPSINEMKRNLHLLVGRRK